jgi:hypothetical protein
MRNCRTRFGQYVLAAMACGILSSPSSLSAGVVGHWPLDDGLQSSGTTNVADTSGNNLHGQLFNLTSPWVTGAQAKHGGALEFSNGAGFASINVGDRLPSGSDPRTLAAWVYAPAPADSKFLSYGSQKPGRSFDFTVELHEDAPHVFLRHWGGNMRYPGAVVGEFMHFAAVVPEGAEFTGEVQIYLNGRRSEGFRGSGDNWELLTDPSPLVIGARSDAFDFFHGIVDDVWLLDESLDEFQIRSLMRGTFGVAPGDFNQNGQLDVIDLDALSNAVRSSSSDWNYDLDGNGLLEPTDRRVWINQLKGTHIGDSNLDGRFNSSDLVRVFSLGEFEDGQPLNSGWEEGDWNGDGDFTTADFVLAFQEGTYVAQAIGAANVPEPAAGTLLVIAATVAAVTRNGLAPTLRR